MTHLERIERGISQYNKIRAKIIAHTKELDRVRDRLASDLEGSHCDKATLIEVGEVRVKAYKRSPYRYIRIK